MAGRQGRRGRRGMTPATIPSRRGDSESKSRFSLALSTTGCRRARPSSVRGLKMLNGAKTGELNSHVDSQNDKRLGLRNSHRQNAKNGNASANICGRFLRNGNRGRRRMTPEQNDRGLKRLAVLVLALAAIASVTSSVLLLFF